MLFIYRYLVLSTHSMTFNINRATTSDIPVIKSMAEVVFRDTYSNILSSPQIDYMMEWMYSSESLAKQFGNGHRFFIAYANDIPCGYMSIKDETASNESITLFHLHKLYVMPDFQGHRIGKALFEKAFKYAKENRTGSKALLELNVNRFNTALGFYLKRGMKITKEGDFPIGNGYFMNDYIMSMEID